MKQRRRSLPQDKERSPRLPSSYRPVTDRELPHPMHPCAKCRHLVEEPAAPEKGKDMIFLRCMAPGEWHGRSLVHAPAEWAEAARRTCPRPAWCAIARRRDADPETEVSN